MSFLDDARKKLTETVNEHGDKIKQGLDKAGHTIDQKTGGKYSEKIERGTRAATNAVDSFNDTNAPEPSHPSPTPDPNAPTPEPKPKPSTAPGKAPGGADEPGLPNDPSNPTG
ncbi:MAG: Rv0909 family putative TA system antitoxin [Marmoricola sp.]